MSDFFDDSASSPNSESAGSAPDGPAILTGVLEKVRFANEETGFTIASLVPDGASEAVWVVGNLFGANIGETLRVMGRWDEHRRFGRQFKVESFIPVMPASPEAIERFLASGLIAGIGEHYAGEIVKAFGAETLRVMDETPERLREVSGIGAKRFERIQSAWKKQRAIREVVLALQQYDLSPAWAIRLYKVYGDQAPAVLRDDPYRLALEVHGIGFQSADRIARLAGIGADDPRRAQAGVKHRLHEYANDGHVFAPYEALEADAAKMLEIDPALVRQAVVELYKAESIVCEKLPEGDNAVYDKPLHFAETSVAERLQTLNEAKKNLPRIDADADIAAFEKHYKFDFAAGQREAVRLAVRGGVVILTGGPGTGKTTTLRGIIEILTHRGVSIALAAPTGRASRRLAETTGMEASTIHRLLKWNPQKGAFSFDEKNPIRADLIVIDEASMIDIVLAHQLLKAVAPSTSLLFVGDVDQLPSVGPGNFLADLIQCGVFPVVRLTEIFRQARQSLIVVNAHRVNHGEFPIVKPSAEFPDPDFFFVRKDDPKEALEAIRELIAERIPRRYGLDPLDDVQVITPMRNGDLGVSNLNQQLQALLNPNGEVFMRGQSAFRVGDKVMQIRNNYDRDVFNGDIGRIAKIDREDQIVDVRFEGRTVRYEFDDLDELTLAYAITVHKAQGSEYPVVVAPMHTQHYILLQRNLFYTALTRGKKLVCVIGSHRALGIAIKNDRIQRRFSGLRQRLKKITR